MQIDCQWSFIETFKGHWSGNKMQMECKWIYGYNQRNINVMQMDYQWNAN